MLNNALGQHVPPRGFTLFETIIALGVFAGAVLVLLGLVTATARHQSEAQERLVAQSLVDAVRIELRTFALQNGLPALSARATPMDAQPDRGFLLVADRPGAAVQPVDDPAIASGFFLIEARRFPSGALAYNPAATYLPLSIRISWPYRVNGSAKPTPASARRDTAFSIVVTERR